MRWTLLLLCAACSESPVETPGSPDLGHPNEPSSTAAPDLAPPPQPVTVTIIDANGSPSSIQIVTHDATGAPLSVTSAGGTARVDVVPGGAVTAVDVSRRYLVSWLGVKPGDVLRDSRQPPPAVQSGGTTTPLNAGVTGVAENVRFLRAKISLMQAGVLHAGTDLSASPALGRADGMLTIADGINATTAWRTLILYKLNGTPEVPSSWLFDADELPVSAQFDASRALPFIDQTQVIVDATRRFTVFWHSDAPLDSVEVGRVSLSWHGADDVWSQWQLRYPYGGEDGVQLPALPDALAAQLLPLPSPDLQAFAEVGLFDFADAARAEDFRRDMSIFGDGVVGAVRDLDQLGAAGVSRLSFDTPF